MPDENYEEIPLLQVLNKRWEHYLSRIKRVLQDVYASRDVARINNAEQYLLKLCRQIESGELEKAVGSLPSREFVYRFEKGKMTKLADLTYKEYVELRNQGHSPDDIREMGYKVTPQQLGGLEGAYQKHKPAKTRKGKRRK